MKQLLLALAIGLTVMGCCERDPDENINPNVLPPATQVGANTGGCLVNGEVWVASKERFKRNGIRTYVRESPYDKKLFFSIGLTNLKNDTESILIEIDIADFKLNKEYDIPYDANVRDVFATYRNISIQNNFYYHTFYPDYIGKIKFTRVDISQNIVSGTFELNLLDKYTGKTITVTEGRFDKKFD